jgi:hypothetical protein
MALSVVCGGACKDTAIDGFPQIRRGFSTGEKNFSALAFLAARYFLLLRTLRVISKNEFQA